MCPVFPQTCFLLWVILAGSYFVVMLVFLYGVPDYEQHFNKYGKIVCMCLSFSAVGRYIQNFRFCCSSSQVSRGNEIVVS